MLLAVSVGLGEQIIAARLDAAAHFRAVGSQVIGQGLLVYAIGALPPLVVGLALLTQPAISALIGWFAYGERLSPLDWIGAARDRRRAGARPRFPSGACAAGRRSPVERPWMTESRSRAAPASRARGRRECGVRRLDRKRGR